MIEVINLKKSFKTAERGEGVLAMIRSLFSHKSTTKVAVNGINFKINDGEIIGYIGSNGAGKSTTIKMMCGILNPTDGKVLIDGIEPYKNRQSVAKKIGVVFGQKTQLWWDIPLIETYKILKEIYEISDNDYTERMQFFKNILGLEEFIHQPVRTLSLGQRMRADLAASLLHNPEILFLDEPTIGLDVLVKDRMRQAIKEINEKFNTTVILTTHDMQDIENLCNRIIIIDEGNIIYDGAKKDIKNKFGDIRTIRIRTSTENQSLDTFNGLVKYTYTPKHIEATFDALRLDFQKLVEYLVKNVEVQDMKINEISIEEVVKEIYLKSENHEKI